MTNAYMIRLISQPFNGAKGVHLHELQWRDSKVGQKHCALIAVSSLDSRRKAADTSDKGILG